MSTHKKIDAICMVILVLTAALAVLFMNGEALGITPIPSEEAGSGMFTGNDLNADWDTSLATKIVLSDGGSTVSGNGAYVYNGSVYIVYPGHYVLTGELTNGSVIIDAGNTDKIWILLDAVTLHRDDDAAFRIEQAGKVFLTLADGTKNTISSGAQYREDAVSAGVDGAIYSRDDLTINGSGTLEVRTAYQHGIVCNDNLVITGGSIAVSAVQDGIHANDSVRIRDAALSISAGDDGITVSNDDETAFLYVESGSITIPACYEGLEAVDITIAGGTIDITPTDDGINASGNSGNSVIRITGGDISITNPSGRDADGLDSNGSIYIEGGNVLISVSDSGGNCALDYGSENGGECVVSGGTVIACGGSMMAEGFDASSTQGFLMRSTAAAAGTVVTLEDSDGRELLSAEIPCSFSSVVLSTPELKVGDVCILTIGGVEEQITVDNTASSGFAAAGMFGGSWGGMRGGRDRGGMSLNGQEGKGGDRPQDIPSMPDGPGVPSEREDFQDGGFRPGGGPSGDSSGTQFPEGQAGDGESQFPSASQMPDQGGGRLLDRQNGGWQGNGLPGEIPEGTMSAQPGGNSGIILLAVSVAVLLAGLLIAFKFKR